MRGVRSVIFYVLAFNSRTVGTPPASNLRAFRPVPNFNAFCGGGRGAWAPVNEVIACFNYLENLGHTACRVPRGRDGVDFCHAGPAVIHGVSTTGNAESSYWCEETNNLLRMHL